MTNPKKANSYQANLFYFLIFFSAGLFGYLLPAIDYFHSIPGNIGDARFNTVILEHLYKWLTESGLSLWSPPFFFPYEGALAFSDNHFGSAIVYIVARIAGFNREISFDVWIFVGNLLNYSVAFYTLRQLQLKGYSAAAGAFVFTFCLPALAQEGHCQLLYRFAVPLAFLALLQILDQRRLINIWMVALLTAYQFYCSIYLGIFLIYLLGALSISFLLINRNTPVLTQLILSLRKEKAAYSFFSIFIMIASLFSIGWLLLQYFNITHTYGFTRPISEIKSMLPRLSSYILADRVSFSSWPGSLVNTISMRHEHQMFFGYGVLILSVFGITPSSNNAYHKIRKIALYSLLILFFMTLRINGFSLYYLIVKIPGLDAIRAVTRIVVVMAFPIAMLVAIGLDSIVHKVKSKNTVFRTTTTILLSVLVVGETFSYEPYSTPVHVWHDRINRLKTMLPSKDPSNSVLFVQLPPDTPFFAIELDAMILAQDVGIPTLNGYSGNFPPGYYVPTVCQSFNGRLKAYGQFRNASVDFISAIHDRILTLSQAPCPSALEIEAGVIDPELARNLLVTISNVSIKDKSLVIETTIKNNSVKVFTTVNDKGPIRLSSRIYKSNLGNNSVAIPGWDSRLDLYFSLRPGESKIVEMPFEKPTEGASYSVEVSLVQEGVVWLHDLGMPIGSKKIEIH